MVYYEDCFILFYLFCSLTRTGKAFVDDCGLTLPTRWGENAPKRETLYFRLPSVAQNVCETKRLRLKKSFN